MTLTVTWYSIICVMAAIPALRVAQIAWLRRSVPAARYLSLLMTVTAVWALCSALEYASIDIPTKITWSKLSYLGVVGSPLFFYLLALVYTNPRRMIGFRHVMTVSIVPILSLALALTNEWHLLIWNAFTPSPAGDNLLIYGHGLWFWIGVFGYSYLLMLVSTIKIVRYAVQSKAPYRTQAVTLALGALIPWLGNIIYNLYLGPISGLELTPLLSICAGVVYYWGIFRVRLLDLTPIAIRTVVESMSDAMVVLDIQERVVDLNTAALRLFNSMAASPIGLPVSEVLAGWPDVLHVLDTAKSKSRAPSVVPAAASSMSGSIQEQLAMVASDNLVRDVPHSEFNLAKDEFQLIHPVTGRVYNTRISTIHDAGNQYTITGRVIVLRDQTVLNQAQEALRRAAVLEERERMARELHDSLGRVLSFLAQNSQTVRNLVESGNTMAALGQLDSLSLAAQTAGMDVRKHILNMRTEMDSGQSFTAVLSQYIDHFAAITGQHVQLSLPDKNMDDVLPE